MNKHTPGPWTLTDPRGMSGAAGVVHVLPPESMKRGPVASVEAHTADWRANARLIAAAPDLLAALVAMRGEIDRLHGYWTERLDTLAQMADAAIAKAKG